jgi:hypothetical protein
MRSAQDPGVRQRLGMRETRHRRICVGCDRRDRPIRVAGDEHRRRNQCAATFRIDPTHGHTEPTDRERASGPRDLRPPALPHGQARIGSRCPGRRWRVRSREHGPALRYGSTRIGRLRAVRTEDDEAPVDSSRDDGCGRCHRCCAARQRRAADPRAFREARSDLFSRDNRVAPGNRCARDVLSARLASSAIDVPISAKASGRWPPPRNVNSRLRHVMARTPPADNV